MRKCTKCNKIKDLDMFAKKVDGKLGKRSHCKQCIKMYDLNRKYEKAEYDAKRYMLNKDKIKCKTKRYYRNNKEKYRNYEVERKRILSNNLSKLYKKEIEAIYKKCKDMNKNGIKYHVDHIVPIRNSKVCGLHVPWNLQIIEKTKNLKKSNKFT